MSSPDELVCCWCDAERIQGERDDVGCLQQAIAVCKRAMDRPEEV